MQLGALAWTMDSTLWPYAFKCLIDKLLAFQTNSGNIWLYLFDVLLFWAGLWIFIEILWRLQSYLMANLMPRYTRYLRDTMFEYLQGHSYDFFANHFAGNLSNKVSDMVKGFTRVIELTSSVLIPATMSLIVACVIFTNIAWPFAVILLGWASLHFLICILGGIRCARLADQHADSRSRLSGKIVDIFSNMLTVKLFANQYYEQRYLEEPRQDEQQYHRTSLMYTHYLRIILGISCFLGMGVLMTWYLILSWQQGQLTLGQVVLLLTAQSNITVMIWVSSLELPNLFREIGACQQAYALMRMPQQIVDAPLATRLQAQTGHLCFDKVSFHYPNGVTVFDELSLSIPSGAKIGLVGYSGSGKTSFVNLLLRFYEPQSGYISIDHQNIAEVTLQSLREAITMIPQEPTLFHRSLFDNIAYGHPQVTPEAVHRAALLADCEQFISQLPDGFDTFVGERGIKLSGGQRQRIAIARAILKSSPILILDEATSALDSVTEQTIQTALVKLMHKRTTLVIAHRLSTLAHMDEILVFDQGRIIETGHHHSLLAQRGHYAQMWHRQAGGFLPEHQTSERF